MLIKRKIWHDENGIARIESCYDLKNGCLLSTSLVDVDADDEAIARFARWRNEAIGMRHAVKMSQWREEQEQ